MYCNIEHRVGWLIVMNWNRSKFQISKKITTINVWFVHVWAAVSSHNKSMGNKSNNFLFRIIYIFWPPQPNNSLLGTLTCRRVYIHTRYWKNCRECVLYVANCLNKKIKNMVPCLCIHHPPIIQPFGDSMLRLLPSPPPKRHKVSPTDYCNWLNI